MNCPACAAPNEDDATVCFTCGRALGALTLGTRLADRYTVLAVLGRGGMGTVYRAHDQVLDEAVAVKVLRPELAATEQMEKRFRSELKLARRVSHPNVCRIHDYGREGAIHFISMELVGGRDLRRRLDAGGPLDTAEACRVAAEAADGLQAIHDVGVVHRDLKTANLMLDEAGRVRVMDFGIAAPADHPATPGASYVVGSPEYMSPEQARGLALDGRSDLYSLGVVLFELLTGRVPFRGDNPVATVLQQLHDAPDLDRLDVPAALRDLLSRLLAKQPADRPATASAVARELRAVSGGAPAPTQVLPRPRERASLPLALLALGLVVAAIAGTFLLARRPAIPDTPAPAPALVDARPIEPPPPAPTPEVRPTTLAPPAVEERSLTSPTPVPVPRPSTTSATPAPAAAPTPTPTPGPTADPGPPPTAPAPGLLRLAVKPWADVVVDGRPVGQTPLAPLSLAAGPHDVELRHPDYRPWRRRAHVVSGQTLAIVVDLRTDGVRAR